MSETLLTAKTGRATGDGPSGRLRATEQIPAVVYGQGMQPISVQVGWRELRKALSGPSGLNTIIDLQVDGDTYPTLVKDIQRHPVRHDVLHVDFFQVNLSQEVSVAVPIRLLGEAKAVELESGIIDQVLMELTIQTTPRNIPNELEVDISEMTMDTVITVSDIALPSGVTTNEDADRAIVTAVHVATPVLDAEEAVAEDMAAEAAADGGTGEQALSADDSGEAVPEQPAGE